LWEHLRREGAPAFVAGTAQKLRELLRRADYQTPQALIAWLLTGPWEARARLVERLGSEANDPLDELLNAAFVYEAEHWPSLAGFITWFDAGTSDLKRDSDSASGQVRVMTVHGSKGLQAPIVILADATGAPGDPGDLALEDDPVGLGPDRPRHVPLPPLNKDERKGPIAEAAEAKKAAALQEHWRLLYVALTRARKTLLLSSVRDRMVPWVAVSAPVLCYVLNENSARWFGGYTFGFEILMVNGLLTLLGLWLFSDSGRKVATVNS
jgi:ATP-dependent helicase/nuclease subunit A